MSATSDDAAELGRVCAEAARAGREMRRWAAEYPGLYKSEAFDPALFATLAQAAAFSGPWWSAEDLRMANRVCLWCFGLDFLLDYAATSRAEVDSLAAKVLAVAEGAPAEPGDELTAFLADIRDELAALPAYDRIGLVWRDELRRMVEAMVREWEWKSSGELPGLPEYLANADNLGFSFVFAGHWAAVGGEGDLDGVREASWAVQRVIRLLNDLGTVDRDRRWGDLNALLLGVGQAEVEAEITGLMAEAVRLLEPLPPRIGGYMRRQMEFCSGFYGVSDFWGAS